MEEESGLARKVEEAKGFCRYELKVTDLVDDESRKYFQDIFNVVYLTAQELKDPSLPFRFHNDFILFAHHHANTLREHIKRARESKIGLYDWEEALIKGIEHLDKTKWQDMLHFLDTSTETMKSTIDCERK